MYINVLVSFFNDPVFIAALIKAHNTRPHRTDVGIEHTPIHTFGWIRYRGPMNIHEQNNQRMSRDVSKLTYAVPDSVPSEVFLTMSNQYNPKEKQLTQETAKA